MLEELYLKANLQNPTMKIHFTSNEDVLILYFDGSLDTGSAIYAEAETNKHLKNYSKIVMDLRKTKFVSSAGLRLFLTIAKRLLAPDGILCLCNANEIVTEILEISGFTSIIDVKPSLEEALTALGSKDNNLQFNTK